MNTTKLLATWFAVLATVVFSMSLASATLTITEVNGQSSVAPGTSTNTQIPLSFRISTDANVTDIDLTGVATAGETTNQIAFSQDNFDLLAGQEMDFTATITFVSDSTGDVDVVINATGTQLGTPSEVTKGFAKSYDIASPFCIQGEQGGDLRIGSTDVNNQGSGEDDEWFLLDNIEIDVDVENNGDEDADDVVVELGIFDENGDDVTDDFDFTNDDEEQIDVGSLDEGDEETVTFEFRVPADFDEGNYDIIVKAYNEDSDFGEDVECVEEDIDSVSVDLVDEDDTYIVVDDIVADTQATCGSLASGTFTVFNIGDEDEDRVLITLENGPLGLSQEFEVTNLDSGDDQEFSFTIDVPGNVVDDIYTLEFYTFYDYRQGDYRERSDAFFTPLNVIGCGDFEPIDNPIDAVITAELASDAEAGEELVVEVSVRNTGEEFASFSVSADDFDTWAELTSSTPSILSLNADQSGTVTMRFAVNDDATGTQTYIIEVRDVETGAIAQVQEVQVSFGSSSSGFDFSLSDNGLIWAIGIVNLVLIIIIIVVAVRVSRR